MQLNFHFSPSMLATRSLDFPSARSQVADNLFTTFFSNGWGFASLIFSNVQSSLKIFELSGMYIKIYINLVEKY